MGYLQIGIFVLLAVEIIIGIVVGLSRGRKCAFFRLIIVVACVAGAAFLTPILNQVIMEINTGNGTVREILDSLSGNGNENLPEQVQKVKAAIYSAANLLIFIILFILLRLLTKLLFLPLYRSLARNSGGGALFGLIQGVVIAFAFIVPLNSLSTHLNTAATVVIDGKTVIELPMEVGVYKYQKSETFEQINSIGGWYLEIIEGK